jgi:uncharacterized membrane protein HdeD (DUF308 family)
MSEPAYLAGRHACGGRHRGWAPAYGTITLRAAIAVLSWPGEKLLVAAALRGIQLTAAGPFNFAAAVGLCSIHSLAVLQIAQP